MSLLLKGDDGRLPAKRKAVHTCQGHLRPKGLGTQGAETGKPKSAKPEEGAKTPRKRKRAAEKTKATRSRRKAPSANKKPAVEKAQQALKAGDSLLLGWELEDTRSPLGFREADTATATAGRPIWLSGEGHMITIAPTGAGKGRGD